MLGKRGFLRRTALAAVVSVAGLCAAAVPLSSAKADGWKHHRHWYGGYGYVVPGPVFGAVYAPAPVYVAPPPPVYVAPPPVVYAPPPPPVYYGPPTLSFGITFPLR
ncbi:MAG TPA: hypothetical protein VFA23_07470 [Dongiaceae bacterium]|nr:hypothetical protein [Dongiaceae bacterium]